MTVFHLLIVALGSAVAIVGALTNTSGQLASVATFIIGGALGHAGQPKQNP